MLAGARGGWTARGLPVARHCRASRDNSPPARLRIRTLAIAHAAAATSRASAVAGVSSRPPSHPPQERSAFATVEQVKATPDQGLAHITIIARLSLPTVRQAVTQLLDSARAALDLPTDSY